MKLSKTAAHAVLAVAHLAQSPSDAPVQARHIAGHLAIPTDSALKILQALARQRLLRSRLGRNGGYWLDKAPDEVSLLQIVEAVDGPIRVQMPLGEGAPSARRAMARRLRRACEQATQRVRDEFAGITVASLLEGEPVSTAGPS